MKFKYFSLMLIAFIAWVGCGDQFIPDSDDQVMVTVDDSSLIGGVEADLNEIAPSGYTVALNDYYRVNDLYSYEYRGFNTYKYTGENYSDHKGTITQTSTGYIIEDEAIGIRPVPIEVTLTNELNNYYDIDEVYSFEALSASEWRYTAMNYEYKGLITQDGETFTIIEDEAIGI